MGKYWGEALFFAAGLAFYYLQFHPTPGTDLVEQLLEYIGNIIGGTVMLGILPYILLRKRIENPVLKVFSISLFLSGLLIFASNYLQA